MIGRLALLSIGSCALVGCGAADGEGGTASTGGATSADEAPTDEATGVGATSGATTSGSTGEAETTGESTGEATGETTGEPGCPPGWADDLALGPGPVALPEGTAVPIDVVALAGRLHLAGGVTTATAELRFRVGEVAGRPIFDLRQEPLDGLLDGQPLAGGDLWTRDVGGGPQAEVRVLDREVPACSEHLLTLSYPLTRPPGIAADPPKFDEDGVVWDLSFSDLLPRMFLEQWLPANLIHDRHPISITLEIPGAPADQRVITNGVLDDRGDGVWQIDWPARSTALSPMLVLSPGNAVVSAEGEVMGVAVEVHRSSSVADDLGGLLALVEASLASFEQANGAYAYPRFVAWVHSNAGMEYDGGATAAPGSLVHEVFHGWWGRGLSPMRAMDGWIDEAWNDYNTQDPKLPAAPKDLDDPRPVLCDRNPWSRVTPFQSYDVGKSVFSGIAAQVGVAALQASMRDFYAANAGERVTTEMLERHLRCGLPGAEVRLLFHRFVYGLAGSPAPPPADDCAG